MFSITGICIRLLLAATGAAFSKREQSEQRKQPEQSQQSEQSEQREQRKQPEQSEQSEQPEQSEQSQQPEQREQSEQREQRVNVFRASIACSSVLYDRIDMRLLFSSYTQVTSSIVSLR